MKRPTVVSLRRCHFEPMEFPFSMSFYKDLTRNRKLIYNCSSPKGSSKKKHSTNAMYTPLHVEHTKKTDDERNVYYFQASLAFVCSNVCHWWHLLNENQMTNMIKFKFTGKLFHRDRWKSRPFLRWTRRFLTISSDQLRSLSKPSIHNFSCTVYFYFYANRLKNGFWQFGRLYSECFDPQK